ncbi:MAG TPA: glycosyltransferase family 1 protein [Acidimicrobiales bacterium]|nr:glycosyltransferase family 1 protein [Acidimicrobiales bacterium]
MKRTLGVNLLYLVPGVVGGTEEYAVRVLRAVAEHPDDDLEVLLYARDSFARAYPDLASAFATKTLALPANRALRVAAESTWLARESRGVDAMHHLGGRVPAFGPSPSVVTVHDLQPLQFPASFSAVKRRFLAFSLPRSVRKAQLVVSVSEWVRRSIIEMLHIPEERTAVVSAPCEPMDRAELVADERVAALPVALRHIVQAADPFFVYPAITYEHKNHRTIVQAFAPVARAHPGVRLVLTGGTGPLEGEIRGLIAHLGLEGNIVRTGRIERTQLDTMLALARALVFPSTYEGFGLPVIEALRVGCPPIVANATALPEAVGGAGILVEPLSVDGWTDALDAALSWDGPRRGRLVAAGARRLEELHPARVGPQWQQLHRRLW